MNTEATPQRPSIAAGLLNDLVALSRRFGEDPDFARGGGGNSSVKPYRIKAWVCPPQISMIVQGRMANRPIACASLRTASASRYSSRYFMAKA